MFDVSKDVAVAYGVAEAEAYRNQNYPNSPLLPAKAAARASELARFWASWWLLGAPGAFTMPELRRAHDALTGERYDHRNFQRDMLATGLVERTGATKNGTAGRPAEYYRPRTVEEAAAAKAGAEAEAS